MSTNDERTERPDAGNVAETDSATLRCSRCGRMLGVRNTHGALEIRRQRKLVAAITSGIVFCTQCSSYAVVGEFRVPETATKPEVVFRSTDSERSG